MKKTGGLRIRHVTSRFITKWVLVTILLLIMPTAYSATINVTSTADVLADDGVCTLREAVIAANENFPSGISAGECISGSVGLDTIALAQPGTYGFSIPGTDEDIARTGDLDIIEDVVIEGGGAAKFIIHAAYLDRVIQVASDTTVVIRSLTLTGGMHPSKSGGGIFSNGTLTVEDSIIAGNHVGYVADGAGVYVREGTLILTRTVLRNNLAYGSGDGGGIFLYRGTLVVSDCEFDNNSARYGGAIGTYVYGTLSVTDSLFTGNSASRDGGAISNATDTTVVGSMFVGNVAIDNGGAVYTTDPLIMNGSTFHRNASNRGGAIYTSDSLFLNNSTFNRNAADTEGGGFYVAGNDVNLKNVTFDEGYDITSSAIYTASGTVTVSNTLIAGRCGGDLLISNGGNIESSGNTCGLGELTDKSGVSASAVSLGTLKDNGGKTLTQLPGSNSVALENGSVGCLFDDQRGVLRPQDFDGVNGPECDVGAVELMPCLHDEILTLDNTTIWVTPVFEACERIEAGNGFEVTDTDTAMRSGNSVELGPNFSVLAGASLSVNVNWGFWEDIP